MDFGVLFYLISGLWASLMVVILISAIRLCYRIEARSEGLRNRSGVPAKAMILHAAMNWKVARDAETQAMRRAMNVRLLLVLGGMVLMALGLRLGGAWN